MSSQRAVLVSGLLVVYCSLLAEPVTVGKSALSEQLNGYNVEIRNLYDLLAADCPDMVKAKRQLSSNILENKLMVKKLHYKKLLRLLNLCSWRRNYLGITSKPTRKPAIIGTVISLQTTKHTTTESGSWITPPKNTDPIYTRVKPSLEPATTEPTSQRITENISRPSNETRGSIFENMTAPIHTSTPDALNTDIASTPKQLTKTSMNMPTAIPVTISTGKTPTVKNKNITETVELQEMTTTWSPSTVDNLDMNSTAMPTTSPLDSATTKLDSKQSTNSIGETTMTPWFTSATGSSKHDNAPATKDNVSEFTARKTTTQKVFTSLDSRSTAESPLQTTARMMTTLNVVTTTKLTNVTTSLSTAATTTQTTPPNSTDRILYECIVARNVTEGWRTDVIGSNVKPTGAYTIDNYNCDFHGHLAWFRFVEAAGNVKFTCSFFPSHRSMVIE